MRVQPCVIEGQWGTRVVPGTITEIVGGPGSGRTQCCMMLAVMATLPAAEGGFGGKVIYIDTESTLSPSRLLEIATTRYPQRFPNAESLKVSVCTRDVGP